jgi:dihydrofolate reductase
MLASMLTYFTEKKMRKIVYYVAISIDGFIAGENDDISGFTPSGNGVEQYLNNLKGFDTVIMGKRTYEFGYLFGMKPGQKPYPHMKHYIFSQTLVFEKVYDGIEICPLNIEKVKSLKEEAGTPIYMCGGGKLAEWLLENELIDEVKLKLNPHIIGSGIRLFGKSKKAVKLSLKDSKLYDNGLQIMSYEVNY